MSDPFDTGELPPGLREEYLAGMRAALGVLAAIVERLAAAANDREALEVLQREAHKIHGSAGSYGFMDASRLAAGMEVTAKDWVAHADDRDVDRGSLARWFVARLAEMLGLHVPSPPSPSQPPPRPPAAAAPRKLGVGPPPRPSQAAAAKPTQPPRPASRSVRPPARPQVPSSPAPAPSRPKPKAEPTRPPPPRAPTPATTELPWILSPEAAAEPPAAAHVEPVLAAQPIEPVAEVPPAAAEPEPPLTAPPVVVPPEAAAPAVEPEAVPAGPEPAPSAPSVKPVAAVVPATPEPEPPPAPPPAAEPPAVAAPTVEPQAVSARPEPAPSSPPAAPLPAAEAPVADAPAVASDVPEVIFVEDDAALAELLAYGLRTRGYRFVAYRNGREALRELIALDAQGTHPLLLLDVDLPALDGYSIFAALQRERPGTYRVVFTTVHGTEEEQLRGLEAGALDYLVKPISLRVALEKIKRWVGR